MMNLRRVRHMCLAVVLAIFAATLTVAVTTQPASAAVGCEVGVEPAELLVTRDASGNPTGRYAYGWAWADCASNEPVTLKVCVKFQTWTGSTWVDYTQPNCNSTGGSGEFGLGATITLKCSQVGSALIRTKGTATIRGTKSGLSQTRSGVEVGTRPCA